MMMQSRNDDAHGIHSSNQLSEVGHERNVVLCRQFGSPGGVGVTDGDEDRIIGPGVNASVLASEVSGTNDSYSLPNRFAFRV